VFDAVEKCVKEFGGLNILVNNAAFQKAQKKFEDIEEEDLRRTFETNISATFLWLKPPFRTEKGDAIINTGSIVGKTGIALLIDYSSSKGAIHSFTKSLALNLGERESESTASFPVRCGRRTFPARCRLKKSKISVTKSP
jgi:NAD(P)-dependent dehydrogenase (short-subunit alcohol dehydrogenase family)